MLEIDAWSVNVLRVPEAAGGYLPHVSLGDSNNAEPAKPITAARSGHLQ